MDSNATTAVTFTTNTSTGLDITNIEWSWVFSGPGNIAAVLLITIQTVLILCLLFGNGLVVVAFWRFKKLRVTKTNYFLASLAVSDAIYGLTTIVALFVVYIDDLGRRKYVCLVNNALVTLCIAISVFNLVCVSVDRLIAIAWPFRYPHIVTGKRVLIIKGVFFVLALAVSFLPVFGLNQWHSVARCIPPLVFTPVYVIACTSFVCLLMFITLGIYFYIFRIAKTHFERIVEQESLRDTNRHKPSLKDLKAANMLLLIGVIFIVCWGTSYCILGYIISNHDYSLTMFILEHFGYSLILLSSALNPLVYAFRSQEFRWAFEKLLRRHRAVDATENSTSNP